MKNHCIYPGCNKENVTEDSNIPLCEFHKGILKERGIKIVSGVAMIGGTVVGVMKNGGIDFIKRNGPKIAKTILNIVKR